jgi:poly(hydroxyalkanoate) depolymerase family esterase
MVVAGGAQRPSLAARAARGVRRLFRRAQPAREAPPPGGRAPAAGRVLESTFGNAAGRRYLLYVPTGYRGRELPLVVMLHGGTQTAEDFAAGTRMNELAERENFLVAYPEQPTSANQGRYWNWFLPGHQRRGVGEPSLIAGITERVARDHAVDRGRVYVAGLSAGAAMAAVMAATYPDVYAAAGIHSGVRYGSASTVKSALGVMAEGPPRSADPRRTATETTVPLIVFHGDADERVVVANADAFLAAARTSATDGRLTSRSITGVAGSAGYRHTRTVLRRDGRPVIECWVVQGLGHAWSGGSPDGSHTDPGGPDASAEFVRFFLDLPANRPGSPSGNDSGS